MDRFNTAAGAAAAPTAPSAPVNPYFTKGNPGSGIPATQPGEWWFHMITEEVRKVIVDAGLTPDHTNVAQLSAAITALASANASSGVQGMFKNLKIVASGATNTNAVLTADEVVTENASNQYKLARTVSLTINSTASGANGLDTGSLAASTWYSVWVIMKADGTTAGLLSLSATAPTMPSGYTFKARLGWVRTDGTGNKYLLQTLQFGRKAQYVVLASSNVAALPSMASGAAGNTSTPTWASVATGNFVPTTAGRIQLLFETLNGAASMVAPNNQYGVYNSMTNPPPFAWFTSAVTIQTNQLIDLALESANVYWANNGSAGLFCQGWEDNI